MRQVDGIAALMVVFPKLSLEATIIFVFPLLVPVLSAVFGVL
jgi:hypothetical protein